MRTAIDDLLETRHSVCTRDELLTVVTRNQLDDEIRRSRLIRLAPRTYARPWDADLDETRELAAQRSVGPNAALSHITALRRCGLPVPKSQSTIHVTTSQRRRVERSWPDVIVHRTALAIAPIMVGNARTVPVEWAIAASWPLLSGAAGRAPAIAAIRRRLTSVDRLRDVVDVSTRLRDRSGLLSLLDLIEAGCQSELEIWGYANVFDTARLRGAIRQRTVVVAGAVYRLDMAYERERLAVELDGREYHAGPAQWEHDIARDLALATIGWQTLRLSHRRLTTDVAGCRRDVERVLQLRQGRPSAVS